MIFLDVEAIPLISEIFQEVNGTVYLDSFLYTPYGLIQAYEFSRYLYSNDYLLFNPWNKVIIDYITDSLSENSLKIIKKIKNKKEIDWFVNGF